MRRKVTMIWLLSVWFALSFSLAAFAGWREERRWKYENEDGSYKVDEWFTDRAGKTYYLDQDGFMVRGWHMDEGGAWYFFDSKGIMVRGLAEIDGMAYYFQEDGRMFEGDRRIEGRMLHFSRAGAVYPEGLSEELCAYDSQGVPMRETGQYDGGNPGRYLPFAAIFAIGVCMGWIGRRRKQGCEMMFLFISLILSSTPLLNRYLCYGHDLTFHLNRILGMVQSLRAGMFPVRINGFTFDGYGYPDPIFYPQLFLYIPAGLHAMGVPFVASVNTFLLLTNWAAAMTMYLCGKRLFGSSSIGCGAGMLYTMGVYRLCNAYTRAAYGELLAMVFFPLVIWGLYEVFYGEERHWAVLTAAFTGIFQSHLISTVLVAGACAAFGIAGIRQLREKKRAVALGKALGTSFFVNLWTLVPLLAYMRTGIDTSALQFPAESNVAPWSVFLKIFPGGMGVSPQFVSDLSSVMPLSLGLSLICGVVLVLFLRFFTEEKTPKPVSVLLWTGLGLVAAASDWFPWAFLVKNPVVKTAASYIQFPWRFLAIAICCLSLAAAYGADRVWASRKKGLLYLGILLVSMVSTQYYIDQVGSAQARVWTEHNVTAAIGKTEYLYPGTPIHNLLGQVYASNDRIRITDLERGRLSVSCGYESTGSADGAYLEVPLLYFPGYRAQDGEGKPLEVERGEGNLIRVKLTEASGRIRVFFKEPVLWRIMEGISLAAAAAVVWEQRRVRKGQDPWKEKVAIGTRG